jgi:hypothetical protein
VRVPLAAVVVVVLGVELEVELPVEDDPAVVVVFAPLVPDGEPVGVVPVPALPRPERMLPLICWV